MSPSKDKRGILCVSERQLLFTERWTTTHKLSPHILHASIAYLWFATVGGQILVAAPQQLRGTVSIKTELQLQCY